MWIESHQSLRNHRKVIQLADELRVSRVTAVGHLHYLWWWALDNAPGGDLQGCSDRVIAEAGGWKGQPLKFVVALRSAGFLDSNKLHDWYDYAGKLTEKRKRDAARKKVERTTLLLDNKNGASRVATELRPSCDRVATELRPRGVKASNFDRLHQNSQHKGSTESNLDIPSSGHPADIQRTSEGHPKEVAGTVPNLTEPIPPIVPQKVKQPEVIVQLPSWIEPEIWKGFLEMRRVIKKPATQRAQQLIIGKLERFKESGHDPSAALKQSIINSWQDVYEPKPGSNGQKPAIRVPRELK